jgi:hypothetical protein
MLPYQTPIFSDRVMARGGSLLISPDMSIRVRGGHRDLSFPDSMLDPVEPRFLCLSIVEWHTRCLIVFWFLHTADIQWKEKPTRFGKVQILLKRQAKVENERLFAYQHQTAVGSVSTHSQNIYTA